MKGELIENDAIGLGEMVKDGEIKPLHLTIILIVEIYCTLQKKEKFF